MVRTLLAIIAIVGFTVAGSRVLAQSPQVTLTETGSSLLYPVIAKWADTYKTIAPSVTIETASTGSGAGIAAAKSGAATIGASDAYLPAADLQQYGLLNIPVTISAQTITYNIPEIGDQRLNLDGPVLAAIYQGKIRYWDDHDITAINLPLAGKLPHAAIVPIVRSDASGDTFIFTQYLSKSDAAWKSALGSGLSVKWPSIDTEIAAKGNPGVLDACSAQKYTVCYLGISFLVGAGSKGLYYAALANGSGSYVVPSIDAIGAAALSVEKRMPADQGISMIDESGDAYPLVNFEYAVVKKKQTNAATAEALRAFLRWAMSKTGGNNGGNLAPGFTSLPPSIAQRSLAQVASIQ